MAFTGDASHIPISNIVQALFMNGQEGVLSIDDGKRRRNVRILKIGIRPLASSPTDPDILRQVLVKEKILTDTEFQNTISTWDPSNLYPGEFLLRRRVVTPEQVQNSISRQLEELIFEIFATPNLTYEFRAGEQWLDHELFDPEGLGQELVYSVNGVLMESVRREDDWRRIETEIKSEHEIFTPKTGSLPISKPDDLECSPEIYKGLRKVLNGERTVARLIEDSPYSRYEVSHLLFHLKSRQLIRSLDDDEKRALAEKLRRVGKTKETIGVYLSLLATSPDEGRTRAQLISLLEKAQQPDNTLLVEQYFELLAQHETSSPEKALEITNKILEADPSNLAAYEKQFELLAKRSQRENAVATARTVAKLLRSTDRLREGIPLFERFLASYPEEPFLLHELSDAILASGEDEKAVPHLKTLARVYDQRGDVQRLRKTCQMIVRIDPSESQRFRKAFTDRGRRKAKPKDLVRAVVIGAVAALILGAAGFVVLSEVIAREAFASIASDVQVHAKYSEFARARVSLAEFERAFQNYTFKSDVHSLRNDLKAAEQRMQEQLLSRAERIEFKIGSALAKSVSLEQKEKPGEALRVLTETRDEVRDGLPSRCRKSFAKLEERIAKYERAFASAQEVADAAARAEADGEISRAHATLVQLIREHPDTPAATNALLPVLIHARPDTASVFINGSRIGERTPIVAKLPPGRLLTMEIRHRGYATAVYRGFNPVTTPELFSVLEKQAEWSIDGGGPIDAYAVSLGDQLFFPTRNGDIHCLRDRPGTAEPLLEWTYQVPDHSDITGGIGVWNNLLFAGAYDGRIYVLNARTGRPHAQPIRATRTGLWIKEAPSAVDDRGVLVVNCADQVLSGVSLRELRAVWTHESSSRLVGSPQSWGGDVFAFTTSGQLLRLAQATGQAKAPIDLGGQATQPGRVVDGVAFAVLSGRTLRAVNVQTGGVLWTQTLSATITAPPTVGLDQGALVVPTDDLQLACFDPKTGRPRWRSEIKAPIRTEGVVFINSYFVGLQDGRVASWNLADGNERWSYETAGASESPVRSVLCRGHVSQGKFYQGSDDGRLYCLLLD